MWQWLTTSAAQLTVLVTFLYTLLTGVVVILMWRSNRQMRRSIEQSAKAEQARARPYIIVELSRERSGFVNFKVSNVGASSATSLRLSSNPEIKPVRAAPPMKDFGAIPDFIGLFRHTIPYLAPSQSLDALVGHYSGIRQSYPELRFTVSLDYDGIGGPYSETIELSFKPSDERSHLTDYDIGQELHNIHDTLEKIKSKLEA
jgi:hypothetical protein